MRSGSQRGVAAVEFALIAPVFFMMLFGLLEFGQAFWKQQIITSVVREAARYGVVAADPRPSAGQITTKAQERLTDVGLDSASSTITIKGAGGDAGDALTVLVEYPAGFKFLHKFIGLATNDGSNIMLSATMVMELE